MLVSVTLQARLGFWALSLTIAGPDPCEVQDTPSVEHIRLHICSVPLQVAAERGWGKAVT